MKDSPPFSSMTGEKILFLPGCSVFCKTLLPVFGRGHSLLFFKDAAEIQRIVITDQISDLRDVVAGCFQKHLRIGHAPLHQILHGRRVGILLKAADEPADAHAPGRRIFFNTDFRIVIVIKKLYGKFHLFIQIHVFRLCSLPICLWIWIRSCRSNRVRRSG